MSNSNSPKYGRHSIRFKLVAASVAVQIVMLSLLVWNSTRLANEHLINRAEAHIQDIQPLLNASIAGPLLQEDLATLGEILNPVINEQGIHYIAVYSDNNRLFIERGHRSSDNKSNFDKNLTLQQHMDSNAPGSTYHLRTPITIAGSVIGDLEYEIDTKSISQAINSHKEQGATIAIAEIILSIFLLAFLAVRITQNLRKLTFAVSSLSPKGEILDVDISSKDEVGGLSVAFKEMTQKLQQREQERDSAARATQESDDRYKRLVENLSSEYFFYSHDTDGVFFYVSESISDVLGYTQNDFLTHYRTYLTDNLINKNLITRGNDGQATQRHPPFVISIYHKDGSERMLEVSESPVIDGNGNIIAMEGIAHDITSHLREADELRQHRDNLEILITNRTVELETTNNELESFCYSVSHDLRAPLRSINGFSNVLLEDYEDTLDETGRDHLKRITLGTERMSRLIDDLLNLSRITRYTMDIQPVNLTKIANEIIQTLRESDPKRSIDIELEDDLHTRGDKNLLTIALTNLIDNAWKYTGKCDNATMNIRSEITDGTRVISITDNGAGFNTEYSDKLFTPFQRLHGVDEFPGSGIGLSTVHRIITRHHGKIWASSTLGKGATFYFTLNLHES